ncbi:hypothetical protein B4O97_05300 [Marispirochaeta aestuarii]|uniref:Outer membrane protein beta-barrel domain-containing protein n=1 Tax=Marispirochaeta aestuarii TaxID=1963862 RepID=A0A1Y1RZW6_9SPIO|nr:hypothetical protein [Marispirochaeta aestuarii]ORC36492.1 hypothetical protein B4O97_05300 [Marispirochaeta aestuarii]
MKKRICISLLLILALSLSALEIGASFNAGSLNLSPDRKKDDSDISGTDYLYGVSVFANAPVADNLSLETGLYYDPVLRYSVSALLNYRSDYFQLKAGPFFGFLNDWDTILKPGISTEVLVDVPGTIFARLRADSSIGGRIVRDGDYLQEKSVLGVGFYIPNAICEVSLENKTYTEKTSSGEKENHFRQYAFSTDVYQKNRPYRVKLTFAYQTRTLSFIEAATVEHVLNSLVLGTRLDVRSSDRLDVFFDLESNIYSFGEANDTFIDLAESGIGVYLFSLTAGFRFSLD